MWKDFNIQSIALVIIYSILFFPLGLFSIPFYTSLKKKYLKFKELRDLGLANELLLIAEKEQIHYFRFNFALCLCLAALVDLEDKKGMKILHDKLEELSDKSYNDFIAYTARNLTKLHFAAEKKIQSPEYNERKDNVIQHFVSYKEIPTTKVYLLNEKPVDAKCMISKLPLDFQKDTILACPNCGNFAKKELFSYWLQSNGVCPICKKALSIDKCPPVIIKKLI